MKLDKWYRVFRRAARGEVFTWENHIRYCIWKFSAMRAPSGLESRDYNYFLRWTPRLFFRVLIVCSFILKVMRRNSKRSTVTESTLMRTSSTLRGDFEIPREVHRTWDFLDAISMPIFGSFVGDAVTDEYKLLQSPNFVRLLCCWIRWCHDSGYRFDLWISNEEARVCPDLLRAAKARLSVCLSWSRVSSRMAGFFPE